MGHRRRRCEPCSLPCAGGACHPIACGNFIKDQGEACDDGNTLCIDGCSADCRSTEECGNEIADPIIGEECDTGIASLSGDGCTSRCTFEIDIWRDVSPANIPQFSRGAMAYSDGDSLAAATIPIALAGARRSVLRGARTRNRVTPRCRAAETRSAARSRTT